MITELAQSLYNVIVGLNMAIVHNLSTPQLQQEYAQLKSHIEAYERQPTTLYREIFEEWCKTDVISLYSLIETLINKDDEWSDKAYGMLPDIGVVANSLCQIADEIEKRRGDIIAEISPTPQPDTSTPVITDLVIATTTGATPTTGGTAPDWWRLLKGELDTDRARKYFGRAIERELILPTTTGFKWIGKGGNTLIALLCGMIYCGDEVTTSRLGDIWKLGKGEIFPNVELKELFGAKSLGEIRTNKLDSSRQKTPPRGWRVVVELFED